MKLQLRSFSSNHDAPSKEQQNGRTGGGRAILIDVRVVAATNPDLG
jgi:hypothetical protein